MKRQFLVFISFLLVWGSLPIAYAQRSGEGEYKNSPVIPKDSRGDAITQPVLEEEDLRELLKKAQLLFDLEKIDAAVLIYYDILNQDPQNIAALEELLKVFFTTKNWAMIISTLERLAELQPDNLFVREMLVLVYNYYQMPESALQAEIELTLLAPQNQEYLFSLAQKLEGYGLIDETIDLLETLHKLAPENVQYLHRLAVLYEQQYRLTKSIMYYNKLVAQYPDDWHIKMELARVYLADNQYLKTQNIYLEALQHTPDNLLLQEEVNYLYAELARDAFYRDKLGSARQYFRLSKQGKFPYPFADEYLQELEREMSLKTFYGFEQKMYNFHVDITKTLHSGGIELPIWRGISRYHLFGSSTTIEDPLYTFTLNEIGMRTNVILHDRIRTHLVVSYSEPESDLVNVTGKLLYKNIWNIDVSGTNSLKFGIERQRVLDSIEAIDKNIFKTEYSLLLSQFSLKERLWTAIEYKYGSYTGDNQSHLVNLDVAYTPIKRQFIPHDIEQKPPLYEIEKNRLDFGVNVEYVTFKEMNDIYFTYNEKVSFFVRAGYSYTPIEPITLSLKAATGKTNQNDQVITDMSASLRFWLPFRLRSEVSYTISDDTNTLNGAVRTSRTKTLFVNFLLYF